MKKLLTFSFIAVAVLFAGQSIALEKNATVNAKTMVPISVTTAGAIPTVNLAFSSTLRPGTYNTEVIALQTRLKNLGYYTLNVDGKYGPGTKSAVAQFQAAHRLSADGIAGVKTFASLSALANTGGIKPIPSVDTEEVVDPSANVTACTRNFEPVCGKPAVDCVKAPCPEAEHQTYGNTCLLEASNAILLYDGACLKEVPTEDVLCTTEYMPVCGQTTVECVKAPCLQPKPITYGNSCMAKVANATLLYEGVCKPSKYNDVVILPTISTGVASNLSSSTALAVYKESPAAAVSILQASLKSLGYYNLNVDGKYGPATVQAVKKYQMAKSLKADGIVGVNTLSVLAVDNAASISATADVRARISR